MAYRKTTRRRSTRRSYSTKRRPARRSTTRRRRSSPQTVKVVVEMAPQSVATSPDVISARQVKPKKATF